MTIILDASAALRFIIAADEKASKNIYSAEEIIAPDIFHSETGNAMRSYVKFKQMTFENAYENLLTCFSLVTTFIDMQFYSKEILDLAIKEDLSYYDSQYLFLALNSEARILTFDKAMYRAAKKFNVEI